MSAANASLWSERQSTILHTNTLCLCSSNMSESLNRWTAARLGMFRGTQSHQNGIWYFFFLFKPCSGYAGQMTGAFPKKWSNATWMSGPAPKPTMHQLRGHTEHSWTAQHFTSTETELTAGASNLHVEGATHTDPSMLDTFIGCI